MQIKEDDVYPKGESILKVEKLKDFFTVRLNCSLLEKNIIELEMFLCANYIGDFLSGFCGGLPSQTITYKNGYKRAIYTRPVEHLFTYWQRIQAESQGELSPDNKSEGLLRGAQLCFVISVFFPTFQRRRVGKKYYHNLGSTFFYQYWLDTKKEVTHHMAERFEDLVPLTRDAIED